MLRAKGGCVSRFCSASYRACTSRPVELARPDIQRLQGCCCPDIRTAMPLAGAQGRGGGVLTAGRGYLRAPDDSAGGAGMGYDDGTRRLRQQPCRAAPHAVLRSGQRLFIADWALEAPVAVHAELQCSGVRLRLDHTELLCCSRQLRVCREPSPATARTTLGTLDSSSREQTN